MTKVTEYATTFGLLQWDRDGTDIRSADTPIPPKGDGWELFAVCLAERRTPHQPIVWTWRREVGLSAEAVAKTVGVAVPGMCEEEKTPRWALSTESAEDSWGGNQVRRVLRDGKWAATAPTDVASEIVAAMNAREAGVRDRAARHAEIENRAAVEALRDAAGALVAGACDEDDGVVQWLRTRADRIERGEKP